MEWKLKVIGDSQLRFITAEDLHFRGRVSISYEGGSGIAFAEDLIRRILKELAEKGSGWNKDHCRISKLGSSLRLL